MWSDNRKTARFGVIVILGIIFLYVFWVLKFFKSADSFEGSDAGVFTEAPADDPCCPERIAASQLPDEVNDTNLELPVDERTKLVEQLLNKGLPIQPSFRRTVVKRIQEKKVEQMVAEIGDAWAATGVPHGISMDYTDPAWLMWSYEQNLRVKQLIMAGRKDPEMVGRLIARDLMERTSHWLDTVKAVDEAYNRQGSLGFAVADDETSVGSSPMQKQMEDRYAIVAHMFVMMNIGYTEGLDTLGEFLKWKWTWVPGTVLGRKRHTPKQMLSEDILFFAVASLLEKSTDQKYEKARVALQKLLDSNGVCKEIITDAPDALWPENDPILKMANVDTSSEPKMTLLVINQKIVKSLDQWPYDKGSVLVPFMDAYQAALSSDHD